MVHLCTCVSVREEILWAEDSLDEEGLSPPEDGLLDNALLELGGARYVIRLWRSVQGSRLYKSQHD